MNEEYLFKGKEKDSEKWLEWNAIAGIPRNVSILTDTICRCTGLRDKNGKLIWENDIMKYQWNGETRVDVVKYDAPMFSYKNVIRWSLHQDEVIGNVFDNPELLEGGK